MKKIVWLSERLPFPPTSGTKNLLFNYCKILHDDFGIEVVNISFLEKDEDIHQKPDFISKTYELPTPSGLTKLKNIVLKTFIKKEYPLQVSLFWDPKIKKEIDRIIKLESPDCVIADFIRTTEYLKDFKGVKIADLQDLLSLRYERQLKVDLKSINPYGAYLFRFPKIVQYMLQLKIIKRYVMETEIKLLKGFEKKVGDFYDRVMFVAGREGELFDEMVGQKKSLIVPLGVDYDYFSESIKLDKKNNTIAFMGALSVAHNEFGITHFIEKCMPKILKLNPDVKLYVIGGGASDALMQYAGKNVIFTGRVPDVRVAIGECDIFICPLQFGSGIKTKNLEAMAMGVPLVTTLIGAENIDAIDGKDWLLAKNDQDFCDKVLLLLNDKDLRNHLSKNGQSFIKEHFTWDLARKAFREII